MPDPSRFVILRHALRPSAWCLLIIASLVIVQPRIVAAQDSDTEFLEFENKNVPSPQQLLEHLNRLRGVNLQLAGTGPNGLPGNQAFQEWVTQELLPSLDEDQQEQLKEIARKMRDRQLGGQTATAGADDGSGEPGGMPSPLQTLREELRQNPELEASLRERLAQRPDNPSLSNLLGSSDTSREELQANGAADPRGSGSDSTGSDSTGTDSTGTDSTTSDRLQGRGQGAEPERSAAGQPLKDDEVNRADGSRGGNLSSDETRSGSQTDGSGRRPTPLANQGLSSGAEDDAQGRQQSSDPNGARTDDRNASDAQLNPQSGSSQRPEDDSTSEFSGNRNRGGNASPNSAPENAFRPSRPGRGTSSNSPTRPNGGNRAGQPNRNEPASSGQTSAAANERAANPNESFRDRLNRILLDAANDTTAEESQAEGGEAERRSGALNGFLNQIASRFQESMRDPERRKQFQDRFEQQRRAAATRRITSPSGLSRGSDFLSDSGGIGLLGMVLLIGAFTFVVVMFFSTPMRERMFGMMNQYASGLRHARGFQVPEITSPRQLVDAIDRFVFWRFGLGAHWWHGGYVHQQLVEAHPHRVIEIDQLLDSYETARYSPASQSLDEQRFAAAARCLQSLKDETLAQLSDDALTLRVT